MEKFSFSAITKEKGMDNFNKINPTKENSRAPTMMAIISISIPEADRGTIVFAWATSNPALQANKKVSPSPSFCFINHAGPLPDQKWMEGRTS